MDPSKVSVYTFKHPGHDDSVEAESSRIDGRGTLTIEDIQDNEQVTQAEHDQCELLLAGSSIVIRSSSSFVLPVRLG